MNFSKLIIVLLVAACAGANRDNTVDPVNTPIVQLATPVFDAGTILLEWQYYSEGDGLAQFEITRTAEGESSTIGVIPVTTVSDGWQTSTLRDTVFIAGIDVLYQVFALDGSGVATASSSGRIRVGGTNFDLLRDPWNLQMLLTWSDEPSGTIGYEVLRNGEVIFTTDDPSVHAFADTTVQGNTPYAYLLRTRLSSGKAIESDTMAGNLFGYLFPLPRDQAEQPANRYLVPKGLRGYRALALTSPQPYGLIYTEDPPGSTATAMSLPDSDPETWSVTLLNHSNSAYEYCVTGLLDSGRSIFVSVFSSLAGEPAVTKRWLSTGGSRTGVLWAGEAVFGKTVFYVGTTLHVLDDDFEIVERIQIDTGEPIDIEFDAGSIWLAYPDRLVRSNDTFLSEGITSWETVPIPSGITITAMTRLNLPFEAVDFPQPLSDTLIILDGNTGKLHVLNADGEILLSWEAQGDDLARGDISIYKPPIGAIRLLQTDGKGTLHLFQPAGSF